MMEEGIETERKGKAKRELETTTVIDTTLHVTNWDNHELETNIVL